MRTSFFLTLIAATALLFTGCATKAGGDGYGDGQDGAAFAGGGASIDPNGAGFDPNHLPDDGRAHVGLENVRNRLKDMCNGTLTIKSKPSVGTRVIVEIPVKRKSRKEKA